MNAHSFLASLHTFDYPNAQRQELLRLIEFLL